MKFEDIKINKILKITTFVFVFCFLFLGVSSNSASAAVDSGQYTSGAIDFGSQVNYETISWTASGIDSYTQSTGCTLYDGTGCAIKFQVAVSNCSNGATNAPACDAQVNTWNFVGTDGSTTANATKYFTSSSQTMPASLNGNRYLKYKVYISTDTAGHTPSVTNVTFGFSAIPIQASLISSAFDTTIKYSALEGLSWNQNYVTGSSAEVRIQLSTSGDNSSWTPWMGPNGTSSTYWDYQNASCTGSLGGSQACQVNDTYTPGAKIPTALRSGSNDQYVRYKIILTSLGGTSGTPPKLVNLTTIYNDDNTPYFESNYLNFGQSVQIKNLYWTATVPAGAETSCNTSTGARCAIKFQIATAPCQNGKTNSPSCNNSANWTFKGPGGSTTTYWNSQSSGCTMSGPAPGPYTVTCNISGENIQGQYLKYKAYLFSEDTNNITPFVKDVSVDYAYYYSEGTLLSSQYNTTDPSNILNDISLSASYVPAGTSIIAQVRSTKDDVFNPGNPKTPWSGWCGPNNCNGGDTYISGDDAFILTSAGTDVPFTVSALNPIKSNATNANQWLQYRVILKSNGNAAPLFSGIKLNYKLNEFPSSATFTSTVIDTNQTSNFTTVTYTKTTSANNSVIMNVGAGNTSTPDSSWVWVNNVASGGDISALNGRRYVQYKADLSTTVTTDSPSLDSIIINYYKSDTAKKELISSPYNSGDGNNVLTGIDWTENLSSGTDIGFQIRTASTQAGLAGAPWQGPGCTSLLSDVYTDSSGAGNTICASQADASGDQWFQYRALLSTTNNTYPTLYDVTVRYTYGGNAPTITQSAYRLFYNVDNSSVQTAISMQDTPILLPGPNDSFRLRMLLHIGLFDMDNLNKKNFRLQYAEKFGACDSGFIGENYQDVTSSTPVAYSVNPSVTDGSTVTSNPASDADPNHLNHTVVNETYIESDSSSVLSANLPIPAGQDAMWDFSLKLNNAPANKAYCLRMVKDDYNTLTSYFSIPEIDTNIINDPSTDTNNIRGFAWSPTIGWISFSCHNNQGAVCGTDYGVHMITQKNINDGLFPGFTSADVGAIVGTAWSDKVGWISFDRATANSDSTLDALNEPLDPFSGKPYIAKIDLNTYEVAGLARAINGIGEGWDGWISLRNNGAKPYGVALSNINGDNSFTGFAWGGQVLDWMSLSNSSLPYSVYLADAIPTLSINTIAYEDGGLPPVKPRLFFADKYQDNRSPLFKFVYDDTNRYNMKSYSITIRNQNGSFVARMDANQDGDPGITFEPAYGSGTCYNEGGGVMFSCPKLDRDAWYDWTLSVTNVLGNTSTPKQGPAFYIQPFKYPAVDFGWDPKIIVPDSEVTIKQNGAAGVSGNATCYDYNTDGLKNDDPRACSTASGDKFLWGTSDSSVVSGSTSDEQMSVTFGSSGYHDFKLQILGNGFNQASDPNNPDDDWARVPAITKGSGVKVIIPTPEFQEKRP